MAILTGRQNEMGGKYHDVKMAQRAIETAQRAVCTDSVKTVPHVRDDLSPLKKQKYENTNNSSNNG